MRQSFLDEAGPVEATAITPPDEIQRLDPDALCGASTTGCDGENSGLNDAEATNLGIEGQSIAACLDASQHTDRLEITG